MCIMYSEEDKVYPKESSHFYEPITNDKVLHFNQTDLYKNGVLGLEELDRANRFKLKVWEGKHCDSLATNIERDIVPILNETP